MFRPSQPVASILTRNAVLSAFDFVRTLDAQRVLVEGDMIEGELRPVGRAHHPVRHVVEHAMRLS